jgi:hypothetical protein
MALRGQPTQPQTSHNDHAAWSPPATSTGNPRAHPAPLTVDLAHCQLPPTTMTKSTLRWPSTACASFERQAPTSGRRPTVVDMAGDHPDPGHPSRAAAGPTATPRDLIPVGHRGRRNARTPDAGHRTPGRSDTRTGHRSRGQAPVEHRTLAPDTGHERGHGDDSTAGIRTTSAARERPHAETPNRLCALALPAGCSAALPAAKRRLGALLS